MSLLWQHCVAHAFGLRRASVASFARAVRPTAASTRAKVFQGLGTAAENRNGLEPWRLFRGRASLVTVAPELIGRSVSRMVAAMRSSPNSNTKRKVSIRQRRAVWQPGCSFGSVSGFALPVGAFGSRVGPNPSFKRTRLRRSA